MENLLQSLAGEKGLLPLILITTISIMVCLWKYGGDFIKLFKRENEVDKTESKYEVLVHKVIEDGKARESALNKIIENNQQTIECSQKTIEKNQIALEQNQKILEITNKTNQEMAITNKELSKTNRELFNKISFKMDTMEDKIENINEDVKDVKEAITVIKTRTER